MFGSLVIWGQSVLVFSCICTREYGSIDWFYKNMETEVWVGIVFGNCQTGISMHLDGLLCFSLQFFKENNTDLCF